MMRASVATLEVNKTTEMVIELKPVEKLLPIHEGQTLTYLKLGSWHVGLLLNFNVPILINGIKRMVYELKE